MGGAIPVLPILPSWLVQGHLYLYLYWPKAFPQRISNFKSVPSRRPLFNVPLSNTGCTQKNGAVSKVNKRSISHLTRAQRTPSAAATVQVSHALPAVRFSCFLRGRGVSFQDGVAAGEGFQCARFWVVQVCDYSAAWVYLKISLLRIFVQLLWK